MHPSSLRATAGGNTRVTRCFAFVDLCGFTDFADTHEDDEVVAELKVMRSTIREVAPIAGIRVDKWLGDGALLVGVDCEPLVAAVLVIRKRLSHESRLTLRAGIASGDVIVLEGDDYVGRAVNVAARLCEVAAPGRIVAWTNQLEIPEWATSTPMEPVRVKGMARYVDAVALEIDESVIDTVWTAPARALRSIMALMHPRPRVAPASDASEAGAAAEPGAEAG